MSELLNFRNPTEVKRFVEESLADNPRRILHILEIAKRVRETADTLGLTSSDLELAECAALLHDIGYWQPIATSGFHPIDGATFLERQGEHNLARLIVGHSCSPEEGMLTGFPDIVPSSELIGKLITYWDVQVKQGGEVVSYEERFNDIVSRYGEESVVGTANILAKPRIEKLIKEVEQMIEQANKQSNLRSANSSSNS